ncbi:MAG: hypothetical protein LQ351_002396 [Letrouitia transgressa]|nr:MAG: hypothetical protein LQ351_002396 [Letrouitia transgressa]
MSIYRTLSYPWPRPTLSPLILAKCFRTSTTSPSPTPRYPPRPIIPEEEIHEAFIHGSGPGGQKINKTASAVQLKHLPTNTVVKCQATRSRMQNRTLARKRLAEKLEDLQAAQGVGETETRSARKAEVKRRKKASKTKKAKRKYRALDRAQGGEVAGENVAADDDGDGNDRNEGQGSSSDGGGKTG